MCGSDVWGNLLKLADAVGAGAVVVVTVGVVRTRHLFNFAVSKQPSDYDRILDCATLAVRRSSIWEAGLSLDGAFLSDVGSLPFFNLQPQPKYISRIACQQRLRVNASPRN